MQRSVVTQNIDHIVGPGPGVEGGIVAAAENGAQLARSHADAVVAAAGRADQQSGDSGDQRAGCRILILFGLRRRCAGGHIGLEQRQGACVERQLAIITEEHHPALLAGCGVVAMTPDHDIHDLVEQRRRGCAVCAQPREGDRVVAGAGAGDRLDQRLGEIDDSEIADHDVAARARVDHVIAFAAEDDVVAVAGGDRVVGPLRRGIGHGPRDCIGDPVAADLAEVADDDVRSVEVIGRLDMGGVDPTAADDQNVVARIPAHGVVASVGRIVEKRLGELRHEVGRQAHLTEIAEDRVARSAAADRVVIAAAEDHVFARAAGDRVVAVALVGHFHHQSAREAGARNDGGECKCRIRCRRRTRELQHCLAPDQDVIADAALDHVMAKSGGDDVVPEVAEDRVVAAATLDHVRAVLDGERVCCGGGNRLARRVIGDADDPLITRRGIIAPDGRRGRVDIQPVAARAACDLRRAALGDHHPVVARACLDEDAVRGGTGACDRHIVGATACQDNDVAPDDLDRLDIAACRQLAAGGVILDQIGQTHLRPAQCEVLGDRDGGRVRARIGGALCRQAEELADGVDRDVAVLERGLKPLTRAEIVVRQIDDVTAVDLQRVGPTAAEHDIGAARSGIRLDQVLAVAREHHVHAGLGQDDRVVAAASIDNGRHCGVRAAVRSRCSGNTAQIDGVVAFARRNDDGRGAGNGRAERGWGRGHTLAVLDGEAAGGAAHRDLVVTVIRIGRERSARTRADVQRHRATAQRRARKRVQLLATEID